MYPLVRSTPGKDGMSSPGNAESSCRTTTEPPALPRNRPRPRSASERLARLLTWKRLSEAGWQQTGPAIADAADEIFRRATSAGGAFIAVKGEIASSAKVSISTVDNARRLLEAHGLLTIRRERIDATRNRPNVWILTKKGRAVASAALGVQRVTPTLCKKDISTNPTDSLPQAQKRGRAQMERGVRRAEGATPREGVQQARKRPRPSSTARRALEVSSALGRVPQRSWGHSVAIGEVLRDVAREILDIEDVGTAPDLAETIRARFLPGLEPDTLERALSRRGRDALHALAYVAALTQTRTVKPVRSPAGLFLQVAWHTGQDPALQLVEILAARRRLTAPPAAPLPPAGRPAGDELAKARAWLSSLPSTQRTDARRTHETRMLPHERLGDWPVRAWNAAGRPQPLGGQVVMPCSAPEPGAPRADRDALS